MRLILKFLSLFILPTFIIVLTFAYLNSKKPEVLTTIEGQKILSSPYQNTLYEEFGIVYTPTVILPVKTASGFRNYSFLVDTGAIVSAIPAKESTTLGVNLAFLPRVAVEGYGGQTSFTYRGNFIVKILDDLVTLPCVFSEVDSSNYIIGRKGFFENYTLNFNSEKKAVEFIARQRKPRP